ncbi:MAG: alanine--tRNA ligase, partial [Chloroflexi bacterium]|nr:alanine--tRNA ligase [Chloroflexota bacterium]
SSEILRNLADEFRKDYKSGIGIFINSTGDNVQVVATVTSDLVQQKFSAGEIVRKIAKALGGSGGGRPDLAQGGGKDLEKLAEIEANLADYI